MSAPSAVESRNAVPERSTTTFARPASISSLILVRRSVYDARSTSPCGARMSYSPSTLCRISSSILALSRDNRAVWLCTLPPGTTSRLIRRPVGPHDPHREELGAPSVRVPERLAGTVDLVLAGLSH